MLYEIVIGISEIHKKGFIHRDIKTENIMIRNGTNLSIVIIDLGFCIEVSEKSQGFKKVGSYGYVAPEILKY